MITHKLVVILQEGAFRVPKAILLIAVIARIAVVLLRVTVLHQHLHELRLLLPVI